HRSAAAPADIGHLRRTGRARASELRRCTGLLRGKHPAQFAARPALLGSHLRPTAGRLLSSLSCRAGRSGTCGFLFTPRRSLRSLSAITSGWQLRRAHPPTLPREIRHPVPVRQLDAARRNAAGARAGLPARNPPRCLLQTYPAGCTQPPQRSAGPDPVLAMRAALSNDRGEGTGRSPAGQPEALARPCPPTRNSGGGLLRAMGRGVAVSYRVAVRALCEFTAKQGDLDLRFTPSPTAQEGIAGHGQVAARRGEGYEREVALEGHYRNLQVRGRADGYDPAANRLEEVKTYRGDLTRQPDNHRQLHWAQAKVYGWLLCKARGLPSLSIALVYYDVVTQKETAIVETFAAESLRAFFEMQCERFIDWAEQEMAHRACRDQALDTLRFPYREFRAGQRQLAEAVYKAVCTGTHLMAQAPTGIGKTLATLFPPLKAFPGQKLDKLFFLTAKTPGRRLALDALSRLAPSDAPLALRVLELVARDKACEHPDKACHGESCPLAKGFYDRLPAARAAALSRPHLTQAALREIALQHQVCPYYLGQEMARWADVVIGDYNYYFDVSALLHGLTQTNQWRICVLVDEAHNLLERGRSMYSASLDFRNFKGLPSSSPEVLKKSLRRILRCWRELHAEQNTSYVVHSQLPGKLIFALQQAISAITEYLGEHPSGLDPALQNAYFEATHFCRIAELFGEHSLFDCSLLSAHRQNAGRGSLLCI